MKFLIAPDKLKGSLSATEAADCISAGIRRAVPHSAIDLCPIADGGEGTVAVILKACGGRLITRTVTGPLPEMRVDASFALLSDNTTAVIEVSAASGLALLPMQDRNPLHTTTFGTGQLIAAAIAEGAKKIILGLGGSATIDAGIGMAQACGFTILTRDGEPTSTTEPLCGRDLSNVLMVKHGRGEITSGIQVIGLADVSNPMFGPAGAARTFGAQKGATPSIINQLDADLTDLAARTIEQTKAASPGAGAAGGLGFGVLAFFNGSVLSGFDYIAQRTELKRRVKDANLCITAEGRLDAQTIQGKAVAGVARLCDAEAVPCIAMVGSTSSSLPIIAGLTAHFAICNGPLTLEESTANVRTLLTQAAHNCGKLWAAASIQPHTRPVLKITAPSE